MGASIRSMGEHPAGTSAETAADPGAVKPVDAACFIDASEEHWKGPECRLLERFPVQGTRPIALRRLDRAGRFNGEWMLADILDISLGGLCLLVSGALDLQRGEHLLLDLRAHPGFGVLRLEVDVRWSSIADSFTTLGIAFPEQLNAIPALELERRQMRRMPEDHSWLHE
jgi:hypothetical protein